MWEVVACPVADVEAFLENPLRCVFGGDDGSILDFFSTINGDSIKNAMTDAIVPIAVEFIWVFSGLGWLVEVSICIIYSLHLYGSPVIKFTHFIIRFCRMYVKS